MASVRHPKSTAGAKKPARFVVSVSPDLHAMIKAICIDEGRKLQWIADEAIREWLDRRGEPPDA